MLNTDEEALICDFAETYRIYNYKEIPCKMAGDICKRFKRKRENKNEIGRR